MWRRMYFEQNYAGLKRSKNYRNIEECKGTVQHNYVEQEFLKHIVFPLPSSFLFLFKIYYFVKLIQ